jgi:hypothetical protein
MKNYMRFFDHVERNSLSIYRRKKHFEENSENN